MDTKKLLRAVWFTPGPKGRWGVPVLLTGAPGSGKTSTIEQLAAELGLTIEVVIASLREPADFLGLPIPDNDGVVHYAPPAWARRLAKAGRGIAFLDELNTAPPAVQAALLRCELDGVVGDLALPATVRFVAAQNRVDEAAGGHDLAPPLANRHLHWAWDAPDAGIWADIMLSGFGAVVDSKFDAEAEEKRVMAAFPVPFAKATGLVTSFLRRRSNLLLNQPKPGDPAASAAWPSPRTWEMAIRVMAGAEVHGLNAVETEFLVAGCVGTAAAQEFFVWKEETDLPDPADVLDGKAEFKPDARLDRTMAVFSSCAALVAPTDAAKRTDRAKKLWILLGEQAQTAGDIIEPAAKVLVRAKLSGMAEAKAVFRVLYPVFQAAGLA